MAKPTLKILQFEHRPIINIMHERVKKSAFAVDVLYFHYDTRYMNNKACLGIWIIKFVYKFTNEIKFSGKEVWQSR